MCTTQKPVFCIEITNRAQITRACPVLSNHGCKTVRTYCTIPIKCHSDQYKDNDLKLGKFNANKENGYDFLKEDH